MKKIVYFLVLGLIVGGLSACNSSAPAVSNQDSSSQSVAVSSSQEPIQESSSSELVASKEPAVQSPIPDKELFVKQHNEAATALGSSELDISLAEDLVWGEDEPVEGGFLYDGYSNSYASGVIMFDPNYIRITGRMSDQEACIQEYAAIAAGVTGADPQEALVAMRTLVEGVEPDTLTNGFEMDYGETEYEGVVFTIEIGKDNGITQFWVNPDGLKNSIT